jgi:hypothetical protein
MTKGDGGGTPRHTFIIWTLCDHGYILDSLARGIIINFPDSFKKEMNKDWDNKNWGEYTECDRLYDNYP